MKVNLDPSAKEDWLSSIEHKEASPRTDANKFISCLAETMRSLAFMPLRHPKVPTRDYHYIIDKTYEYKICYYVEDEYVRILYVIHPKENRY
jgi:plasmid stabilization system protein ParE